MTTKTVITCDLCGAELCQSPRYVHMQLATYGQTPIGEEDRENIQRRDICPGCLKKFQEYLFEFLDKLQVKRAPKYERKPLKNEADT